MSSFEEIGLSGPLLEAVRRQGWDRPTALQEAAYAVLRRGGNALLWASPGAGLVGAYALPLLDALAAPDGGGDGRAAAADGGPEDGADTRPEAGPVEGPRLLVLTPTPDRAEHVARAIANLAAGTGIRVGALSPGWSAAERAHVVVGDPASVARAIGRSALKLGDVAALVVEGADSVARDGAPVGAHASGGLQPGAGERRLDTVVAALPSGVQRIVTAGADDVATRELAERLAPKAMGIPSRSEVTAAGATTASALYRVVAEEARPAALGALPQLSGDGALVHCRSAARAEALARALRARGFRVATDGATVRAGGVDDETPSFIVSYDVPPDPATFAERHADGGLVFLAARELQHAGRVAGVAGIAIKPLKTSPAEDVADELGAFRDRVARALGEEDLAAQTLVLAPLVEEHGPMRVAAALSAMARRTPLAGAAPGAVGAAPGTAGVVPVPKPGSQPSVGAAPAPASAPAFTRIFISVGRKDGAGPGDIVGAIAGETGVAGDRIGRIELSETHTIAEIASDDARRVIDALNGTTIRGRSVRVDFDRPRRGRPERRMRGPGPG